MIGRKGNRTHPFSRGNLGATLDPEAVSFLPSGEYSQLSRALLRPTPTETREMLFTLRKRLGTTTAGLGAVLGVPLATVRKWLSGERNPSGAGRRVIWILYTATVSPKTLAEPGAWLGWSRPRSHGR